MTDVDECNTGTPCGANEDCTNTEGSFTCACQTGYSDDAMAGTCVGKNFSKYIQYYILPFLKYLLVPKAH